MAFWHTKKFKDLQEEWYEKLKNSGFHDVEGHLPRDEGKDNLLRGEAIAEYYSMAGAYLAWGTFRNKREKAIWEAHAEGKTIREIAKRFKVSSRAVVALIKHYRGAMRAFDWNSVYAD